MSLKAVDMSIAVHKNADVGQLQREMQQKPQMDQTALAEVQQKATEVSRRRPEGLNETDKPEVRKRREEKKRRQTGSTVSADKEQDRQAGHAHTQSDHPYKGHHIDLSL